MLIDRQLAGGRLQRSGPLLPLFICLVFVLTNLSAKRGAWAAHQDYDELSGRDSERWSLEPAQGQMLREKRATGTVTTTTTSTPSTKTSSKPPTSSEPSAMSSKSPATLKPPAISPKPTTAPTKPATTPSKSPTSSKSLVTSAKPTTAPTKPSTAPPEPPTSSKPPTAPAKPTTTPTKPSTASSVSPVTSKPLAITSRPPTSSKPPKTSTKPSAAPSKSPATSSKPKSSPKPPATTSKPVTAPTKSPPSPAPAETSLGNTNYEARDVAAYLDSHQTYQVHDPRVRFTQDSPMAALSMIRDDALKVPPKSRFAYMMRTFNELGRKIASRMNMFNSQLLALLQKAPDGLGSKPTLSAFVDATREAFVAEEDSEIVNGELRPTQKPPPRGAPTNPGKPSGHQTISSLLGRDKEMAQLFNASMQKASRMLAYSLIRLLSASNETKTQLYQSPTGPKRLNVLDAALRNGAQTMIRLMNKNDKFKPELDVLGYMNNLLSEVMTVLRLFGHPYKQTSEMAEALLLGQSQRMKAGGLSDSTGLVGPWNTYLFEGLGTSERVIRVFASLLADLQDKGPKPRFINMYISQVNQELNKTMSSFVTLMASGSNIGTSETSLVDSLDDKTLKKNQTRLMGEGQELDKDRLPARCYLTGRRWRLLLRKAMRRFDGSQNTIGMLLDRINQIKAIATAQKYTSELDRMCLPRLEVGLKGWGINGEATSETDTTANKFPLRQPIEGLNKDEGPFTSGARMGYRIGFMIGYNDKRNQSLEMEGRDPAQGKPKTSLDSNSGPKSGLKKDKANSTKVEENERKRKAEVDYLARASYRQGLTAGAKKALEIACREGYMTTLKVSVRAGMLLPLEAGASLASLKGSNFAKIAGGEAGRNFVNSYLMDRDLIDEKTRSQLMDVGMAQGSLAGTEMGETVGSIVGHESALEAYRRSITRGGKVTRAKFHMDEYLAGAKVGFDHGVEEGGKVAQSSRTGPHATKFFKLVKPQFSSKISSAFGHTAGNKTKPTATEKPAGSRSGLIELPVSLPTTSATNAATADGQWGQDLISPLPEQKIVDFHKARNHTKVKGTFKGTYNVAKEVKSGLERVSYINLTYNLEVDAVGFSINDITYLSLSGKINNANVLHGSLIAQNIIKNNKW